MRLALGACAGAAGSGPLLWTAEAAAKCAAVARREGLTLADLHVHTMINHWNRQSPLFTQNPGLACLAEKFANTSGMGWEACFAAGVDLLCVTHFSAFDEWASMPTDPNPEASLNTLRMMDQLENELNGPAACYATLARNHLEMADLLNVPKTDPENRMAVVHTLEGGHALGGDLGAIEQFSRRGVAMITITHFFNKGIAAAANSYPFFPDAGARWDHQGLTAFGGDVICEMERHGVIVDITHATPHSVADILKVAKLPVLASHSAAFTLADHPYSLHDEHIEEIAGKGGIIGIIIDPYLLSNYATIADAEREGTLRDVVRNVRHVVKICGDHKYVGIGSDFAGYITPPKKMNRLSQIGELRKLLEQEFGSQTEVVDDILVNNAVHFLAQNWRSGL